ncbi:MAG: hypothetical protein ACIAS6_02580 [Phycisphaerales bacterium JB060]
MTKQYMTTRQVAWTVAADGSSKYFVPHGTPAAGLSPPDAYTHAVSLWESQLGDIASQRLVVPVEADSSNVLLKFFGKPESKPAGYPTQTDNNMYMGIGAIWGVSELNATPTEYLGDWLGQFDVTIGTHDIGSSTSLPADGVFGRRATVRVDKSIIPGIRAIGSQGEAAPVLVADGLGYTHLIVELRCVQPANSTVTRSGGWAFGNAVVVPATGLGFMYRFM